MVSPITSEQIVAGRAFLKWTQTELAEKSGISIAPIKKAESDTSNVKDSTIASIMNAFEEHGIEFIDDGVRKTQKRYVEYQDEDGIRKFYNDVAYTAETVGGQFLVYCVGQENLIQRLGQYPIMSSYRNRMARTDVAMHVLKGNHDSHDHKEPYIKLRSIQEDETNNALFYFIYGDKVALFSPEPKILVINHPQLQQQLTLLFSQYWETANKTE